MLYGKIKSSDENRIMIDCDIVKVFVSKAKLMQPSYFSEEERVWYWDFEGNKLYYDNEEEVRVKIVEVHFNKPNPDVPSIIMEVVGIFNQEGLGPITWWQKQNVDYN
jgi:DNA-directed RNA polymerase subunit E'/Rpb7